MNYHGLAVSPNKPRRKRLGIRDQKKLWLKAKRKCQCCQKEIDYTEMEIGHKRAHSKGGTATIANSVCLCSRCNNLQGTESWATFQKNFCKDLALTDPTEEEPKIDDINRHPERLGTDQPLKLFPNFHNYGADARNIKMYHKVMDRFVELPDIVRSENEIKQSVISVPGTIAKGGSAYLTSREEDAGILFPTAPGSIGRL